VAKSVRPPSTLRRERREDEPLYDNAAGLLPEQKNVEELYAKVQKPRDRKKAANKEPAREGKEMMVNGSNHTVEDSSPPPLPVAGPRRLFILRHAERVDVTFGKQWIQLSFDPDGYYHRRNLNMPKEVPQRKGGPNDFLKDAPVTEVGLYQARLTGEGIREQGIRISHVFSSPALRCVQTAHAILQGLGEPGVKIRVENGLFEWLAWCRGGFPTFMNPGELLKEGFQVDPAYLSQVALNDLKPNETHLEFYKRMYNITRLILKTVGPNSGNVMFVGHAATLEACTRQLVGAQPRSGQELTKMVQKIPYLGMCVAQESEYGKNSTWDFIDPPIPPLTHAPNIRFDWRCLQ
jgi:ubiquitin-associated SH3 domain-containing protein